MMRGGCWVVVVVSVLVAGARGQGAEPVDSPATTPATTPATAPAEPPAETPAETRAEPPAGGLDVADPALVEFARHFSGHEPIYFLAGTKSPNVKFQVRFKYAVANPEAPLVKKFPALKGINLAYTQTSFWDTSD